MYKYKTSEAVMITSPVTIRLSLEKRAIYEAHAREKNVPLGSYLKQKLEYSDDIGEEISELHLALEQVAALQQKSGGGSKGSNEVGLFLEILFLLRLISQPSKVQMAQAEIKRRGFEIWEAQDND
jgi:hypothetical protein